MRLSALVTLWLLALPAVAAAETRIDISPSANFSRYKTFTIEVSPPVRYGQVDEDDTITENRFRRVADYQLRLRGLTPSDTNPDLIVKISRNVFEQTELVSTGGYPYGWHGPWGYGYGGYWGAPYWGNVYTYTYLEGWTRFDVIDSATGQLAYRAEVTKRVDKDEEDQDHDAIKIAQKAFKKFPVRGVRVDD
jgi:Domain of unknown function (DUF4136)